MNNNNNNNATVPQCCFSSEVKQIKSLTRGLHGAVIDDAAFTLSQCGRYLTEVTTVDSADDTVVQQQPQQHPLKRHATHHMVVNYGPGKEKIALITSTLTLFESVRDNDNNITDGRPPVINVTHIESRNWTSEFTEWRDLEPTLATGHFKKHATQQEEEASNRNAEVAQEKSASFNRKLPRSVLLEYFTYDNNYLFTNRFELKSVLTFKQCALSKALSMPNSTFVTI